MRRRRRRTSSFFFVAPSLGMVSIRCLSSSLSLTLALILSSPLQSHQKWIVLGPAGWFQNARALAPRPVAAEVEDILCLQISIYRNACRFLSITLRVAFLFFCFPFSVQSQEQGIERQRGASPELSRCRKKSIQLFPKTDEAEEKK